MTGTQQSRHALAKRVILSLLVLAALGWVFNKVYLDRDQLFQIISTFTWKQLIWLFFSLLIGALSVFLLVFMFADILNKNSLNSHKWHRIAPMFFQSQIVRYLPGRIFGVAYQIGKSQQISPAVLIRSNVEFLALNLIGHGLVSLCILAAFQWNLVVFCIASSLAFITLFLWLRIDIIDWMVDIFSYLLPSTLKIHLDPFKSKRPYPLKHVLRILLVYLLFWLLYLISWLMIGNVFPAIQLNFILIASTYTISWIVGFMSVFTPSGLGIREAIFVYISSVMGAGHLAFLAVFIRIWLTIIDVILAVFSLFIERILR